MRIVVFVLAGGSGTRLAPLSLTSQGKLPKQFLPIVGQKTMLQEAVSRIPGDHEVIVIPEERYVTAVREQVPNADVLAEPFGCNTAPAVGLAALYALHKTKDEKTILFFLPADHMMDVPTFQNLFAQAVEAANTTQKIITLGITPDRPETGYGYIKVKENTSLCAVDRFVEKPNLETAKAYLAEGGYFWNAGMFVLSISTALSALYKDAPETLKLLETVDFNKDIPAEILRVYTEIKKQKLNISIDYAVMEKEAANMLLVPAPTSLEWNDVGGWVALARYIKPDANNNLIINYIPELPIQVNNCRDLLVVVSHNGVLITTQELAPRAKDIIPGIELNKPVELIDSDQISITNDSPIYVGVIGLKKYKIELREAGLVVSSL